MYLNNWATDGIIGMVSDFKGIYITKAIYESIECPYRDEELWHKDKEETASLHGHRNNGRIISIRLNN